MGPCLTCLHWYASTRTAPVRCQCERCPCFFTETRASFGCRYHESKPVATLTPHDLRMAGRITKAMAHVLQGVRDALRDERRKRR